MLQVGALVMARATVEHLDPLSPVGKLIPAPGRERAEVKTWEALADGAMDAAIIARLEATWGGRLPGARAPDVLSGVLKGLRAAHAAGFVHDDVNLKDPTTYERTGVSYAKPGGARLDVKPYLTARLAGPAWYITPALAWRHTAYQLDPELADWLVSTLKELLHGQQAA